MINLFDLGGSDNLVKNNYKVENFSITRVWNSLIEKKELFGFKSNNDFYHLTDLKTFKKLQDL